MLKLKHIILTSSCLLFLSADAAEHSNKSCGTRAWATTRVIASKVGKVGWYTSKGIVIGGCVGTTAGLYVASSICANSDPVPHGHFSLGFSVYRPKNCHAVNPITTMLGGIAGSATGAIIGGVAGFAYGIRPSV